MLRAVCVIPAFEAADTVASVVRDIRAVCPDVAIIVVDDGSRDATRAVAQSAGADVVLRHETNRGKGAALTTGFAAALSLQPSVAVIITMDADGQHDAACLPAFRRALESADLVIGAASARGECGVHAPHCLVCRPAHPGCPMRLPRHPSFAAGARAARR
jgi:glycosyltransferase involved in cell wall biosynthesis